MSERKVATDALATLGTILDENQRRDAIHLAVEPVIAGENLAPGHEITVVNGVARRAAFGKGLGIVDPFLTVGVMEGQRFWFVMNPGLVHSLRHVWTHPAFPDEPTASSSSPSKEEAEGWLRRFAETVDVPSYEEMIEAIGADGGLYFGTDASGEIPPQFWDYAETLLGRKLTHRPVFISCSC